MTYNTQILMNYMENLLTIPSPTGYTEKVMDYVKNQLDIVKAPYKETNKGAIIVTLKGNNDSYQRTFSAHIDTLGAMVKEIKSNGKLSLTLIGGFMCNSIEGENCTILTLENKKYSGTIQTIKPSVHISGDDARNLKRNEENMEIILDEKVFSKEDVLNLGINVGDFIAFDPRTTITENGFIKSRHLDDKASAAILLYTINHIINNNINLPYTTNFFFSNYEEVGHGASACIPNNTKEFISVDMGAPGLNQNSSEYSVCICAKDSSGPYDYSLRKTLINLCQKNNIDYKIDIYPHYGSDASAALRAGWDLKTALIGPGVFASHAYERTHMDSIISTLNLVLQYCLYK
ncbi:M42 family metallopeptidase [Clostridium botulinum]|uniref:Aminopeptidase n=1 Tax=Clostridium botulinum C/D str. DC5 TaxID=1443128 RepID=A0A0A0IED9_CLOBO|nr:M42 family metallopeptidase [Clostridium botulinum]KEI06635.1 aminopeptidase [Clostridium botulinum C/D str. BKT75002]KEI09547.1 aminopeptidase [Clostridium botulinum C/D str. BKT2873]KGM93431.1 aminopeptidase [Clostridium botulinum D str. CCUG 7971]KGM98873.1 aminopeptidase [Clostridium botulinum C/D str. DC5]KOC46907.1 aminopeptidase [Clostridium botulinum]